MKIEVKNVTKKFDDIIILDDVSCTFKSGNIYGLVGRNGSGKSVFQKMICGFYKPTFGSIKYDGIDLNKKSKYPTNLRALIEKPSFFPDITGFDNLKILANIQKKIGDNEINKALEIVNLIDDKNKKYYKYSLGMKQKLGIAQAIMENPDIIVLDEPFNGIERNTVVKIKDYLKKISKDGKIIIISTHIKEDIDDLANRIFEFDDKKILEVK